jgi:hypothetical protein
MVYRPSGRVAPLGSATPLVSQVPVPASKRAANVVRVATQPAVGLQYRPSLWRTIDTSTVATPLPPALSAAVPLMTGRLATVAPDSGAVKVAGAGGVTSGGRLSSTETVEGPAG